MDFFEKARIRMEHWISHNYHHRGEYESLAGQLEKSGKEKSAGYVREMIELTDRSNELLRSALQTLDE